MSDTNASSQQAANSSNATDGQIQWLVLEGQPQSLQVTMVQPASGLDDPPGTFLIAFTTEDHGELLFPIRQGIVGMSGFLQLYDTGYTLYPDVFGFSNAAIFPGENWFRTMRVRFEGLTIFNLQQSQFPNDPNHPHLYRILIAYRS